MHACRDRIKIIKKMNERVMERSFADLCKKDCKPGYVLESRVTVESSTTIKEAFEQVGIQVCQCIKDLEAGREKKVKHIYFGKTYIRQKQDSRFSPDVPSSWMVKGICSRYIFHSKQPYGKGGLMVLAVITRDSIPENYVQSWCIMEPEEYALKLEKRLIQYYRDPRLYNTTTEPGSTDGGISPAYVVYMAFAMDGKFKRLVSPPVANH